MTGAGSARRRHHFRDYLNAHVLVMLALGFSSGLPFLLVGNTFGFWLADEGTSLTAIGFILSCTLCYLLAVQGLRRAGGQAGVNAPGTWVTDFLVGLAISAPVFWMFTKFLAINLPGLTSTGWI